MITVYIIKVDKRFVTGDCYGIGFTTKKREAKRFDTREKAEKHVHSQCIHQLCENYEVIGYRIKK